MKMIEISSLDGMLIATVSIAIILLTLLGWFALLLGKRETTLISGGIALFFGVVLPFMVDFHLPLHIGYWTWLASFAVLIAGGVYLPRQKVTP